MNKSTFKSLSLDNDKGEACVFFGASTSNFAEPKFTINLGYFVSDGDRWELSYGQLCDLREMIDDVLEAGIGTEKSYSNDFNCYKEGDFETPANSQGD